MSSPTHDVVIVGAGVAGALVAKRLTDAGLRVLILEAGPDTTSSYADYLDHVNHFFGAAGKGPESAWPPAVAAPQPDTADLRSAAEQIAAEQITAAEHTVAERTAVAEHAAAAEHTAAERTVAAEHTAVAEHAAAGQTAAAHTGYFVQTGPQLYGSSYTRVLGGSTLHWLGVCLRMLPEDFEMRTRHGVAVDWPLCYDDVEPWYRDAERQIGVSADVADQAHLGVTFPPDYDYPMRRLPPSWSDQVLAAAVDGTPVQLGPTSCTLKIRNYPAGRNSIPRRDYVPVGAVDVRPEGQALGHELGQRCAGNTACTPICPIQAKYNAGKTLAQADRSRLEIRAQAVASTIRVDPTSGEVTGIEYQRYDDPASVRHTRHVATARVYVLAAHAVENAKLLLASGLAGRSGQLGRNLMDHPTLYAWGLAATDIGAFRGPQSTAGLDDCRGGAFRSQHAAFRFDIGNDGWRPVTGAPDTTVAAAVGACGLHGPVLRAYLRDQLRRQIRFSLAVEQLPSAGNGIHIDPRWMDALGNPRPVVSYAIDEYTLAGMVAARQVAAVVFDKAGITDHRETDTESWFPSVSYQGEEFHYHGMGHFAGTHRMGSDPATSVVDPDQRCWEHRNLFLLGSGSFPTMGTSNPTLTMAALALRTAAVLEKELRA